MSDMSSTVTKQGACFRDLLIRVIKIIGEEFEKLQCHTNTRLCFTIVRDKISK